MLGPNRTLSKEFRLDGSQLLQVPPGVLGEEVEPLIQINGPTGG
jgi:hypothetical protein